MKFEFHLSVQSRGRTPPEAGFAQILSQKSAQLEVEETLAQTLCAQGLDEGGQEEIEGWGEEGEEGVVVPLDVVASLGDGQHIF